MRLSRGVLGLPLLMLAFAVTITKRAERRPISLLRKAQLLERGVDLQEAARAYDSLVSRYPGTPAGCRALWELASMEYSAIQDTAKAVSLFHSLVDSCRGDQLVGEAMLMLADIHEIDLRDLEQSNQIRREYLKLVPDSERSHETLFKIGDVLFKQGRYLQAQEAFQDLLELEPEEEIATPVNLRIGTILQVGQDYDRSIRYFEVVIEQSRSPEFRLQARLGLIESYEFLDKLSRALEIARDIRPDEYTAELKNDILMRLNQKKLHFAR